MSQPILIQLGLFGGFTEIAGMHLVEAHTRTLADGSEVFVGEHLRWNRGRGIPKPRAQRPDPTPPEDHPTLFDSPDAVPTEVPEDADPTEPTGPVSPPPIKGTATQLDLWRSS